VQVERLNLVLKAPGIKRLKLKYDELGSSFAFKFNLRRYIQDLLFNGNYRDFDQQWYAVGRRRLTP